MQRGFASNIFVLIIVGVIAAAAVGVLVWRNNSGLPIPGGQKACTQEAKICPDGSGVGRSGPNCEFAACPSVKPTASSSASLNQAWWMKKASLDLPKTWVVEESAISENKKVVAEVWGGVDYCTAESTPEDKILSTEQRVINNLPFTIVLRRALANGGGSYLSATYCITQGQNSFSITFDEFGNPENHLTTSDAKKFDQIMGTLKFKQ